MRKIGTVPVFLALLGGCATPPEHENFKHVMDRQVGKKIDDPDAYPVFYRLRQLNTKQLANGREQRQYAAGRDGKCKLFFEVAPLSGRIERWSFEGDKRDCVIVPPLPD